MLETTIHKRGSLVFFFFFFFFGGGGGGGWFCCDTIVCSWNLDHHIILSVIVIMTEKFTFRTMLSLPGPRARIIRYTVGPCHRYPSCSEQSVCRPGHLTITKGKRCYRSADQSHREALMCKTPGIDSTVPT